MNRLGKLIYTTDFDYKVYAAATRDISSDRVSIDVYIVRPDGTMTNPVTITRKEIFSKKKWFEFLWNYECMERDGIDKVRLGIVNMLKQTKEMENTQINATLEEMHYEISNYIRINAEDIKDNEETDIFIRENYGYMLTAKMDEFVKENKDLGYKRVEILKNLKLMGALQSGKDRPYDVQVSIKGQKRRFYKILLTEEIMSEEVDEIIGEGGCVK